MTRIEMQATHVCFPADSWGRYAFTLCRAAQAYGIELGTKMCRALLDAGVPGLHLYTLNLEAAALGILETLGLINKAQVLTHPSGRHREA